MLSIVCFVLPSEQAYAANASGFNPGKIIDDAVFTNSNSMSASQIQDFLNSKVPVCDTNGTQPSEYGGGTRAQWGAAHGHPTPFTCLKDYSENNISAAQIIYNLAQQYTINPQVLIVLLQKEQGLVTDTWPVNTQYRTATGYGCPDTAPCDSQYYGLTNQLTWSAKMFRAIMNNSSTWYTPYILGNNFIQYNPNNSCGGTTVNIQNRATQALYNYTPYQPNQAALNAGYGTGDGCSSYGNRNFYLYFTDWFGSTLLPLVIKSPDAGTVYIQTSGYKFSVPSMALLQDYGISPSTITTLPSSLVNAVPSPAPSTNLSSSIGYIAKSESDSDADSGAVYFVSLGKRYAVQSLQQFSDFGFTTANLSYLPYGYLMSLQDGGPLSQFISTPTNNVFKVSSGNKQIIFDYSTYNSLNTSGGSSSLSMAAATYVPSGKPISNVPILVRMSNSAIYLFANNTYYALPSMDTFRCWGFDGPQAINLFTVADDSFVAVSGNNTLSCKVTTTASKTLVLNGLSTYNVPSSFSISGDTLDSTLSSLANKLPAQKDLSVFVKSDTSATVWYIEGGQRRPIPSYANLLLLGYPQVPISTIDNASINSLTQGNIKLGQGKTVKSSASDTVYTVNGTSRLAYDSPELFMAYGNKWSDIETYPAASLDASYPASTSVVSRFLQTSSTDTNYLVDGSGCKTLSDALVVSFGQVKNSLQLYSQGAYPYLSTSTCTPSTSYVKSPFSQTVYYVNSGQKQPISSWAKLLQLSNNSPVITTVSDTTLSSIPAGPLL